MVPKIMAKLADKADNVRPANGQGVLLGVGLGSWAGHEEGIISWLIERRICRQPVLCQVRFEYRSRCLPDGAGDETHPPDSLPACPRSLPRFSLNSRVLCGPAFAAVAAGWLPFFPLRRRADRRR